MPVADNTLRSVSMELVETKLVEPLLPVAGARSDDETDHGDKSVTLIDRAMTTFSVGMVAFDLYGDWKLLAYTFYPIDKYYFSWALFFGMMNIAGYWVMGWRGRSLLADMGDAPFDAGWLGQVALKLPFTSVALRGQRFLARFAADR